MFIPVELHNSPREQTLEIVDVSPTEIEFLYALRSVPVGQSRRPSR